LRLKFVVEFLEVCVRSLFCTKPYIYLKHFGRITGGGIDREKLLNSDAIKYGVGLVVMG